MIGFAFADESEANGLFKKIKGRSKPPKGILPLIPQHYLVPPSLI